jgi:hypothetical protein
MKKSGISELSLPSRCDRRSAIFATARSFVIVLAMALAIVLLAGEAARADCTPASANNVTATCTGITTNQGNGAPGTSASIDGYGLRLRHRIRRHRQCRQQRLGHRERRGLPSRRRNFDQPCRRRH